MVIIKKCSLHLTTRRPLWPWIRHHPDHWGVKTRLQWIGEYIEVRKRPVHQDISCDKSNGMTSNEPRGFLNTKNVTSAQGKVVRIGGFHLSNISQRARYWAPWAGCHMQHHMPKGATSVPHAQPGKPSSYLDMSLIPHSPGTPPYKDRTVSPTPS